MKTVPSSILYSRDDSLVDRLVRICTGIAAIQPIADQEELERWLAQFGDMLLIADLRAPNCLDILADLKRSGSPNVVIVMGSERSDPMLAAAWLDPFATTSLEPERREFQALLRQALECHGLRHRTRLLETELATINARHARPPNPQVRTLFTAPLQNFSKAQRNFDNIGMLLESVVDGLVATAKVSRAGIFIKSDVTADFRFQAGTRCPAPTEAMAVDVGDPFVLWMELHTHLVSRSTLVNIADPVERAMLKRMLDAFGAEIIIPLYAAGHLKGWIFVGQRATGIPFEVADLEDLTALADHISTTLEKALQYEATALQKALAETLLHSIPFGIVACDENAIVRWFNSAAREILQPLEEEIIGQRVEVLGSRVADMLHRSLANPILHDAREWTENRTKTTVSAEVRALVDPSGCVGAMMMLRDVTGARLLREKEEQLERAAFWNELAASMSHEIRNPLVAIKTFAQLLPKRYEDPDFRAEFSQQVTLEVDQLNHIIDKINEFANPPKPVFHPLDIRKPIEHAVARIQSEFNHENLKIHLSSDDAALQINGDAVSLEECMYHLLRNAAENMANKPGSRINVIVKGRTPQQGEGNVYIMVTDNGGGIAEPLRDKVYSPFSTTKARGLGLGLPIAKRVVVDHNGQIDIETSAGGTTVSLILPTLRNPQE